ncbi:MAG: hypothetical protein JNK85_08025 [Verrucomicrobiales bacterium]|nr:hypothetical protein [Verrucomicrobiales bacterium]
MPSRPSIPSRSSLLNRLQEGADVDVNIAQVYLVKQRIAARWRKEIRRLSTGAGGARDLCSGKP